MFCLIKNETDKKLTSYKIVKNLDLNRLNIKYFEKKN